MTIIKSIRETVGQGYKKPDEGKIDIFIADLLENIVALDYLRITRGLSDDTIKHFKLGYDKTRDAISIPIYKNKELVNIKYRFLNPKTIKYSSERGAETWLFNEDGVNRGLEKGGILIVEGEIDCMSAWQVGFKNVVSPASGKDSYGIWLERLEKIPRIYICYDNDKGGKESSYKMAERLGFDKCYEVLYNNGAKDANEFFQEHTPDEFRELVKVAKPYYKYQFKGLGEIIESLRKPEKDIIISDLVPNVNMSRDWLIMVAARTNQGKSSYVLNLAMDLVDKGNSILILPIENGVDFVGKRLLSTMFDKTDEDFSFLSDDEWDKIINEVVDKQIFFSVPSINELFDTIIKSRRFFNTNVVVIDHLDMLVRESNDTNVVAMDKLLKQLKTFAFENKILIIAVSHIRKDDRSGAAIEKPPTLSDLRGSGSLMNDPHCVMLLHQTEEGLNVNVAKNKGRMSSSVFNFKPDTGLIVGKTDAQKEFDGEF